MRSFFSIFLLLTVSCLAQQAINPVTQIDWQPASGSGAPTLPCTSANYGQPYTDVTNNVQYNCSAVGWIRVLTYYAPTLTPTSLPANFLQQENFTVTGLAVGDVIGPVQPPSTLYSVDLDFIVGAFVPSANTLAIEFVNWSGSVTTPASGVYSFVAYRATVSTPGLAAPLLTPGAGSYTSAQSVTAALPSGSTGCYTTSGTAPTAATPGTCDGGSTVYSGAISVSSTETLKMLATEVGYSNSSVTSAAYTIALQAATPTASPLPGGYTTTQSVALSDTTSGATIYYTTNGTTPTTSSSVYSTPISVSVTTPIKAYAVASGFLDSTVFSGTYSFGGTGTGCTFSPAGGHYVTAQTVTLTPPAGQKCTYTLDGSTPNIASTLYTAPITVSANTTINAIAANIQVHSQDTQTSLGNISGTGIGYKAVCHRAQTFGSLYCESGGGVGSNQPSNLSLSFGTTMVYTQSTIATSGETQTLIPFFGPGCDDCDYIAEDKWIKPSVGSSCMANIEADVIVYDHKHGKNIQGGLQANQQSGKMRWEYDNVGGPGWQPTGFTDAIPLSTSTYTHIGWEIHRIIGATDCGGPGCIHYDALTVNGTRHLINKTAAMSSTTYRSILGNQDQNDQTTVGACGSNPATVSRSIQHNNVAGAIGPPSAMTTVSYTIP